MQGMVTNTGHTGHQTGVTRSIYLYIKQPLTAVSSHFPRERKHAEHWTTLDTMRQSKRTIEGKGFLTPSVPALPPNLQAFHRIWLRPLRCDSIYYGVKSVMSIKL